MSISFEDSLKKALSAARGIKDKCEDDMVSAMALDDDDVTVYASDSWVLDTKYLYYSEYKDDNVSKIDALKNITVDGGQINVTQESNSQFVPFEMPRYYDGFDLSGTTLMIHFVNKDGGEDYANPINVYRGTNAIRFGWLLDKRATAIEGKLRFEIMAVGANSKGDEYIWKTRPSDGLNILQSLSGNGVIEPDVTWTTSFITQVTEQVAKAQSYAQDAKSSLSIAEGYRDEAIEAASDARGIVDEAKNELILTVETAVSDKVDEALSDYYTSAEVDKLIDEIDISDQLDGIRGEIESIDGLAAFDVEYDGSEMVFFNGEDIIKSIEINSDPTEEWVSSYTSEIEGKIEDSISPIRSEVTVFKGEVEADLSGIHSAIDGLPETLASDYYTKAASDERFAQKSDVTTISNRLDGIEASVSSNTGNITELGSQVGEMQGIIDEIDTSPRKTYDIVYNDPDDPNSGENKLVFYEIEHEGDGELEVRTPKKSITIAGGSGGTGGSLKIGYITTSPLIVTVNDSAIIKYSFEGVDSSGDMITEGSAVWKVDGKIIATNTAIAGENEFDISDYISVGTHKVILSVTDEGGNLSTKSWTVQKIDVRLECDFNDYTTYPIGDISFSYKPYGSIDKVIHFILDGVELPSVNTKSSGIPMSYTLPSQAHGSHLVEAYITAELNGNVIESNHIFKDIIWYDSDSSTPIIGCTQQDITARQYDSVNIIYVVYDPSTEKPTVTLTADGEVISELELVTAKNTWQYKSSEPGKHVLTITCGEVVKVINVEVEELDIDVSPVTSGLVFDFNPVGMSNSGTDRLWSYGDISMEVSDNFDWINGGYQIDENGDQYFCVKSGTYATIKHALFADDPKRTGKEFKVIFKTTNVRKRDASFLSCMDGGIGLDMLIEKAMIYSSNDSLYSPYCEDDIIEFEFNINKDTDIPMVLTYEDGVANRPMIYTSDSSFMQDSPEYIRIGSSDCDVYIYRMKAYSSSLGDSDILSNFIADARNAEEMVSRYERNQIYDENGLLTPEVLAEKCPDLRIVLIDAPWFTNDKSNKVEDTNITMIYKGGDPILDNWTCTGASHSGQGTSSNEYGYAGRNLDLIMNKDSSLFTFGDGVTTGKTITLTRDSTPTNYLNIKVNIASSENENNAQMTMRFNEYQPYMRTARLRDSKIRDAMEFHNCIVFVKERNEDISTHREFTDTEYHYYALGNIGDSKKTDSIRVNDSSDPKECVIEIMDYNVALAEFPTGYTNEDGVADICPIENWVSGNKAYDYLYSEYKYKDGEFKSFGSESYEFRYEKKGITSEEREANINSWREAYKFVVTSSDEEFYRDFDKYFVKDSILYFYLFTERYTMVDNRAKNCFLHRGKAYYSVSEATAFKEEHGVDIPDEYIDEEQAVFNDGYRWDLTFGYDFDTCLGIDNTGKLVLTYGKEDTDYYTDGDPSSSYIYRAAASTFFCRVRDLFSSELQAMFVDRENANAWSSDGLISQWDKAQGEFPEEIWRLDIQRKYFRTYQGISIDNSIAGTANPRFLTEMLNGRKKYQRRMFERNQELYFATKYFGNVATQDQIMMRFNNPVGATIKQDFTLYLTPYADMYIGVKFGNITPTNFRAKAGVEYVVPYGIDADTADITLIYGASFIQAIGDLSKCYVGDNDFSKASRLQSLTIGSAADGYSNTYMTKITLGNNKLLEYLDIRNISGLSSVVDLSECSNLREVHAEGSGATGIIFADGGKLEKAYIPSVISLTAKNLASLEVFDVEGWDLLQSLVVENVPFINTYDIICKASALRILRLVGMDWNDSYGIEDSSILNRLLKLRGIGSDGYETSVSSLSGSFHSSIMKQKELEAYNSAWKDLEISYNTLIDQFAVTFMNADGQVLEVQYVDKGGNAIDPTTRADSPIHPVLASTVSHDFTFTGWDSSLTGVFADRVITAVYSESLRKYSISYVSKGVVMQKSEGYYGENVPYAGDTPTYTSEEAGYSYYLFNKWDKSGFIDGEKVVNAIFDKFVYSDGVFSGRELSDMEPVEIYAMTKLGLSDKVITDKDSMDITIGNDIEYDDIESSVLISEKMHFDGSNYHDTGITLFDEDRDFVLAIDYEFLSGSKSNSVLAQCFQTNGSSGFKLWYSSAADFTGVKLTWGTTADNIVQLGKREMLILRHAKGENSIHVYKSNMDGEEVLSAELSRNKSTIGSGTLVFGSARADDGIYENNAIGNIYWAKVWYADLGDDVCRSLAMWTHEVITMEACGFRKYYLSDNTSKRCSFSLLAANLLGRTKKWNSSNTNDGGWASSKLRQSLNDRLYNAMPTQIRSLMKNVLVYSNDGITSSSGSFYTEVTSSGCYITIPALIEVDPTQNSEPYNSEGSSISYMASNSARKRAFRDGDYNDYWLRSPNASYANYVWRVDSSGATQGIKNATDSSGVLIEISF